MTSRTTVLVGTTKGAVLLESNNDRTAWTLKGPAPIGKGINHLTADPLTGTIWAAGGGAFFGASVMKTTDSGETWTEIKFAEGDFDTMMRAEPEFAAQIGYVDKGPAPFTGQVADLWSLRRVGKRLYAGAKPANLYQSDDDGETWSPVSGLNDHASRDTWSPGGAGLTLHTILHDPEDHDKLWVGISAAGIFASEDGGKTWDRRNSRSNAEAADHSDHGECGHEIGHCVHNMVRASTNGDLIYQQNHHGVFKSNDGGRSWDELTKGLPSSFGFPVAVHPRNPETLWVIPHVEHGRLPIDLKAAVWVSRDGGETWTDQRNGLPQENCCYTVLRQSLAIDEHENFGLYFGTNSGSVFASFDEGENWTEIASHLPTVLCVETLTHSD